MIGLLLVILVIMTTPMVDTVRSIPLGERDVCEPMEAGTEDVSNRDLSPEALTVTVCRRATS